MPVKALLIFFLILGSIPPVYSQEDVGSPSIGFGPASGTGSSAGFAASGIGGCPRSLLRDVLSKDTPKEELINSFKIEGLILKLCGDRTALINKIIEQDERFQELTKGDTQKNPPQANLGVSLAKNSPGINWLEGPGSQPDTTAQKTTLQPPVAPKTNPVPNFSYYTLYGTGTDLTVGIKDGEGTYLLKVGGKLPQGFKVSYIQAKPTRVTITRGKQSIDLPYILRAPNTDIFSKNIEDVEDVLTSN